MKYNKETLKEMANNINLLDYASKTYEFKKNGKDYFCNCPKHIDDTPSLSINEEENFYYCFSCKRHGNIYNWMMDYEDLTFSQAVEKVASLTGTELIETESSSAIDLFNKLKKSTEKSRPDLSQRQVLNFQSDFLDRFSAEIPYEWVDEGISPEVMKEYNIMVDNKGNRIVYPLIDCNGNYISAKGRTRYKDYKLLKLPKYISYNKIGTVDFLVGWQQALPYIKTTRQIIIFEGIKSVMKVRPWGYKNAVASETSHLSDLQIKWLIKQGIKEIIIAYDSDVEIVNILPSVKQLMIFSKVSIIYDSKKLLGGKDAKCSPCDKGKDIFDLLYNERKILK